MSDNNDDNNNKKFNLQQLVQQALSESSKRHNRSNMQNRDEDDDEEENDDISSDFDDIDSEDQEQYRVHIHHTKKKRRDSDEESDDDDSDEQETGVFGSVRRRRKKRSPKERRKKRNNDKRATGEDELEGEKTERDWVNKLLCDLLITKAEEVDLSHISFESFPLLPSLLLGSEPLSDKLKHIKIQSDDNESNDDEERSDEDESDEDVSFGAKRRNTRPSRQKKIAVTNNDDMELQLKQLRIHYETLVYDTMKSLKMQSCHLTDVKHVVLCYCLRKLDLSHNNLAQLPDLSALVNLTSLDLSHNRFTSTPRLTRLKKLKTLNMSKNQLLSVDLDMKRTDRATPLALCLSSNVLTDFPSSLFQIQSLAQLDLSGNSIRKLPIMDQFKELFLLNVSDNKLVSISLKGLQSLEILEANENRLRSLELEFDEVPDLHTLRLAMNDITSIPENLGKCLSSLEVIDLSDNKLRELPLSFSIYNMSSLKEVNLQSNQLKYIPINFMSTKKKLKLQSLNVSENDLEWLHISIVEYFAKNPSKKLLSRNNKKFLRIMKTEPDYSDRYLAVNASSIELNSEGLCECVNCGNKLRPPITPHVLVDLKSDTRKQFPDIPVGLVFCCQQCVKQYVSEDTYSKNDNESDLDSDHDEDDEEDDHIDLRPKRTYNVQMAAQAVRSPSTPLSSQSTETPKSNQSQSPPDVKPTTLFDTASSYRPASQPIKKSSDPYYCEYCDMTMNSMTTFETHKLGRNHLKKVYEVEGAKYTHDLGSSNDYYCSICDVKCTGRENYLEHISGKIHLQKECRKKLEEQANSSGQPNTTNIYYCELCSVDCSGPEALAKHNEGKKHQRMLDRKQFEENRRQNAQSQFSMFSTPDFNWLGKTVKPESAVPPTNQTPAKGTGIFKEDLSMDDLLPDHSFSDSGTSDHYLGPFYCEICQLHCTGKDAYDQHIQGKKHERKVADRNAKLLAHSTHTNPKDLIQITRPTGDINDFDWSRCIQIVEHMYEKMFQTKPNFLDSASGPPHRPIFTSRIEIPDTRMKFSGTGATKLDARREASKRVIEEYMKGNRIYSIVPARLLFTKQNGG